MSDQLPISFYADKYKVGAGKKSQLKGYLNDEKDKPITQEQAAVSYTHLTLPTIYSV